MNHVHRGVVLSVIVRFPFCADRYFAWPILFRLYINKQTVTAAVSSLTIRPIRSAQGTL